MKLLNIVFTFLVFIVLFSCSSDDSNEGGQQDSLSLSSITEFSANQESQTVSVTANLYWYVSNTNTWITLSPTYGTNDGTITVTGCSISKTLTITQAAGEENSGELDPNKTPSQNFDLSTWKLKTPENNGSGFSKTISVSEINAGYENSNYFF
ncbi:BACON domain-containing protein [Winogradskyella sp. PG-2]|uniref:BACON domain-containing protein n=1 Tax=Winogradskyella sp. PG-2 TaxID=754409 RepID=UPI0004587C2D|nr:BACON domain-containing protein [Winogradskyella sp. PG-2]BAO74969.1 alginate lyase precursor [Winogradskyella sp. PG-2]